MKKFVREVFPDVPLKSLAVQILGQRLQKTLLHCLLT